MLERVRITWITGVLEHSLHDAALIALGLREETEVLANPWRLVVQEVDHPAQPLPAGTKITEVYDDADGALLILGEPGAGKTTLLLELARELLARAQADEHGPIPVVFNLSSWAQKRGPLTDWLVEELHIRYQVPRTLGQTWVDNDELLLLLDGLDEVVAAHRSACVKAINSYRQAHLLVPVVVCSRRADYLSQTQQLGLQRAVVVQPLTEQQIDEYLASVGEQVTAVSVALRDDPVLRQLATTPLMLNILLLAYQDMPLEGSVEGGPAEARQEQLFASYVQHMLKRRGAETRYTPEQTTHWLRSLAGQMKRQSQSIFYLEQIQPSRLSGDRMFEVYDWLAARLPGVLMGILVSLTISAFIFSPFNLPLLIPNILLGGLLGWLLSEGSTSQRPAVGRGKARRTLWFRLLQWLLIGTLIGLGSGLSNGLNFGLSFGLCSILLQFLLGKNNTLEARSQTPPLAKGTNWQRLIRRREIRNGLLVGLLVGLSAGLSLGLIVPLFVRLSYELRYGLVFGLSTWALSILLIGRNTVVQPTDLLAWSWRSLGKSLFSKSHASTTVRITALIGLIWGLSWGLANINLSDGLSTGLSLGLSVGLSYWLLLGLFQGVPSATIEDQRRVVPNQGIRGSALNGLVLGLLSTVTVGLLSWLSYGLNYGLSYGLSYWLSAGLSYGLSYYWLSYWLSAGLSYGLSYGLPAGLLAGVLVGLLVGLFKGGLASFRHYVLRFLLWCTGSAPWRYAQFLDDAAERVLLRKVGGGYIFIHRLLLDYFASLPPTTPTRVEKHATFHKN